jgi:hypothetical protein
MCAASSLNGGQAERFLIGKRGNVIRAEHPVLDIVVSRRAELFDDAAAFCASDAMEPNLIAAVSSTRIGGFPIYVQRSARIRSTSQLADEHQVNSIIATAICECFRQHPEQNLDPEEAKQMAKCVVEALSDAGLQISVRDDS